MQGSFCLLGAFFATGCQLFPSKVVSLYFEIYGAEES